MSDTATTVLCRSLDVSTQNERQNTRRHCSTGFPLFVVYFYRDWYIYIYRVLNGCWVLMAHMRHKCINMLSTWDLLCATTTPPAPPPTFQYRNAIMPSHRASSSHSTHILNAAPWRPSNFYSQVCFWFSWSSSRRRRSAARIVRNTHTTFRCRCGKIVYISYF